MMLKPIGQSLGSLLSLTLRLRYALLRKLLGESHALSLVSEAAARQPGLIGLYMRQAFYRRVLQRCGVDVHFGYQTLLSKADAEIGDRVYFGRFCTVGRVIVGNDVRIADGVQLLSGRHHHGSSTRGVDHSRIEQQTIRIGASAWIGANAVVMADVGERAIVGAGAVVTKPVPPGVTVVGVPARPMSKQPQQRRAA
jgi:acetyltransferase-like isoleucine patch superfamily enzyme